MIPALRIGTGFDVHRLVKGRDLVLGGVKIPFELGLLGHSDADCLSHAICDALLGAAGLGDIGRHFPDTDPKYKGISSLLLLEEVARLLHEKGFEIVNIDATVIAQRPRLRGFMEEMSANITSALSISKGHLNLKATTTEGLGFEGRGEGIGATAVVLIYKRDEPIV